MAAISTACQPQTVSLSLNVIAGRYLASVQALSLHDPSLVDHWIGTAPSPGTARRPVADVRQDISRLQADLARVGPRQSGQDKARHHQLQAQVNALQLAARRLLGESFPFDEEASLAFGLAPFGADLASIEEARARLDGELEGEGSLPERLAAFRQRFSVQEGRQDAVMRVAVDRCRAAAAPSLTLPPDEQIEIRFADALGWDGHARYLGGHRTLVEINSGRLLDLTRALRLACHEGYPGHHTQHIWMDDELSGRLGWPEFRLVPGFGRQLLVAEGAAEAGTDLAMPSDRRLVEYRDHLAPAAGLTRGDLDRLVRVEDLLTRIEPLVIDIAREYLDNRINAARAIERLRNDALVASPDALLPFIERQRTKLLAYPAGRALIGQALGQGGSPAASGGLAGLRYGFVDQVLFSAAF